MIKEYSQTHMHTHPTQGFPKGQDYSTAGLSCLRTNCPSFRFTPEVVRTVHSRSHFGGWDGLSSNKLTRSEEPAGTGWAEDTIKTKDYKLVIFLGSFFSSPLRAEQTPKAQRISITAKEEVWDNESLDGVMSARGYGLGTTTVIEPGGRLGEGEQPDQAEDLNSMSNSAI